MAGKLLRGSPLLFLFVTVFVDMIGYGIVIPLLPFYVQQQASGAALVGLLGSLYAAMQFVGGPFLGGLSDRVGRRPVLLLCLFGTSFAYLLLGLADTLLLLVAAVVLAGGAAGTLATAQAYIADSTLAGDRARGLGLIGAAFGLGLIAGPVLGGLLSLYSLGAPAFAASALALCNVAFGFFVLPESLPLTRRTSTPILQLNPVSQLAGVLGVGSIRALLLAVFLLNLSFAGLLTNFPLFSNARFGWDATANAFFFAFVGVCAVLTQGVLLGRLQPRFGEKRLLLGGLALMAVNLGLMALVPLGSLLYPVVDGSDLAPRLRARAGQGYGWTAGHPQPDPDPGTHDLGPHLRPPRRSGALLGRQPPGGAGSVGSSGCFGTAGCPQAVHFSYATRTGSVISCLLLARLQTSYSGSVSLLSPSARRSSTCRSTFPTWGLC